MGALGDWITTEEAARLTGYNVQHIRRLVRSGKIKSQKLGRDYVIDRKSLDDYVRNEGYGPQPRRGA